MSKSKKNNKTKKRPEKFHHFHDCVSVLRESVYMIVRGVEKEVEGKKMINWQTLGTGFLVAPNKMITASHVIDSLENGGTKHEDGNKYYLVRRDDIESFHFYIFEPKINKEIFLYPDKDLAIIYLNDNFYQDGNKIFVDKNNFIRVSQDLQPIGKEIGILGYPLCQLNFENSDLSKPLIGNILLRTDKGVINCRYKTSEADFHYEFTLSFNPGNSGGPIFDIRSGRLVSIVKGYKAIPISNKEIIIPEEKRKNLKEYSQGSFIETLHANYSLGFSTFSFVEIFKKHGIL